MQGKTKFGVIAGAIAIVAVLSISFVAAKNDRAVNKNGLETTLQVSRLSCGSCLATIEGELRKFDGMLGMRADLSQGLVTVSHTEVFTPEKIAEVVTAAGYPAKLVDVADSGARVPETGVFGGSGCGGGRGCGPGGCGLPIAPPERG
jgi:copper chaperone CopZ